MPLLLSSSLRKTLAWLALCAMCLVAAAPTVSRWLAATAQTADLIAICDVHGLTLVPASELQAQAQDQGQGRHHGGTSNSHHPSSDDAGDCCGYCTLLHHSPGVPVAAAAVAPYAPLLAAHYAAADVPAPALRSVRRPQMPQAPPRAVA